MRRMSEDRIRRGELAADVLACDFRLPADGVPCACQQQPSMRARSRGARAVAVAGAFNSHPGAGCPVGGRRCTARALPAARAEVLIDRWEGT
jgi:hypothetical protein